MCVLYLVKTSDASECTLRRRLFHVRLVITLTRNVATSLKAYLNVRHSNLYQKIYELTFHLQKL